MMIKQDRHWSYPGARWWKVDLHTHTPCSQDTYWFKTRDELGPLTPQQWLQRFMDADIDCVAITDHNSGKWIDPVRVAYESMRESDSPRFRELHLFPGVEISVNGGFHLLAILDNEKTTADVDALLGRVDYRGTRGTSDGVTRMSAIEVVEAVLDAGGIPIPAHTDLDKGLLRTEVHSNKSALDANTVLQVLECKGILAIEVVDRASKKPALYKDYHASRSEVIGSDCHSFRGDRVPGSRFTWVKMETPNIDALRLALMDGHGFSIRRNDDPDPSILPSHYVESIELSSMRYMGRGEPTEIAFNPRLNTLVGGRGTGKSTVVHGVRIAAHRDGDLRHLEERSEPRLAFDRFNQIPAHCRAPGGLLSTTRIRWIVMRDGVRYRVQWSARDDSATVEEEIAGDTWRPSSIQAVTATRFPIRIFSQGHIAALAGADQQALLQVIDDAAGVADLQRKLEEERTAFYSSRSRIRELEKRLARRDSCVLERQDIERKLRRFEEAGHAAILTNFRLRSRQVREVDRQIELMEGAVTGIGRAADSMLPEDVPDELFDNSAVADRSVVEVIAKLAIAMEASARELRDSARRLTDAVARARSDLADGPWRVAVEDARSSYGEWVGKLHADGVRDPSEYGRLVQDRQRLDGELAGFDSMLEERNRLVQVSQSHLQRVLEARRAVSDARKVFLEKTLADNKFVSIHVRAYGDDAHAAERSVRKVLNVSDDRFRDDILVTDGGRDRGEVARWLEDLPADPAARRSKIEGRIATFKKRVSDSCGGVPVFRGHFNNYLQRESERTPELLDRVLAWFPEDGLSVEYSRSGNGKDFQPIGQASAGQRAAAMLAFLLAHGEEPLVLDQPEDDLDNQLIYDLIVQQIRQQKLRRQIIVVTHNANVVVNGDAEMVYVLDFCGQCFVRQQGSLQQDEMRAEVCRVMEGGREAFDLRYRRLGMEPGGVR